MIVRSSKTVPSSLGTLAAICLAVSLALFLFSLMDIEILSLQQSQLRLISILLFVLGVTLAIINAIKQSRP